MRKLRHRISLQQHGTSQDAAGQVTESWTTYRDCSARVFDKSGAEKNQGDRTISVTQTVVEIRYPRSGRFPVAEDRVLYRETNGRTRRLNIKEVSERDGVQRALHLQCVEDDD